MVKQALPLIFTLLFSLFSCKDQTIVQTYSIIDDYITKDIEIESLSIEDSFSFIKYLGEFRLTAYCGCEKCCGKYGKNRPLDENGEIIVYGSIGERLHQGISVAVDPNIIPYYSYIKFDDKIWVAHDTGGSIKGNRIDVYFFNHQDALKSGMNKTVSVYICY